MGKKDHSVGLFRDSIWSTATTGATVGFQMAEIMILSRVLPKGVLGSYFLIIAFPEMVQGLLDLRLQEIMIKYLVGFINSGETAKVNALIKLTWGFSVVAGLLVLLIVGCTCSFASSLVSIAADKHLMLLYAVGLLVVSLQGRSGAIIRALGRFDANFFIGAANAVCRLALVAVPALLGYGLPGVVAGIVVAQFLNSTTTGLTSLLLLRKLVPLNFRVPVSVLRPMWRELAHFAFHLNLASASKTLAQRLDTLLVGALLNPSAVAAYKVVGQLSKALYLISDPLATAAYPRFVQLVAAGDLKQLNRLAWRSSLTVALVLAPVILGCALLHQPLLALFAGAQYKSVSWLLPFFMLSNAAGIILFWTHSYLLSIGRPQYASVANIVGRLIGLGLFAVLLATSSLFGAAIGSGIPACLSVLVSVWFIFKFLRTRGDRALTVRKAATVQEFAGG